MSALKQSGSRSGQCCAWMGSGWLAFGLIVSAILVLDRVTKIAIAESMPYGASESVIGGFFNLVHVRNRGIAFSMFADAPPWFRDMVLPAVSLAAIVVIVAALRQRAIMHPLSRIGLALILAGAAGNLCDRLLYGYVTDFLDIYVGSYHWPAFNVADSALTVGAILLIWDSFADWRSGQSSPNA